MAKDVNAGLLKVVIDNREYTSENIPFYMNQDRNIMIPVSMLRDALSCSAHIYGDELLLVEKHNKSVSIREGEKTAYLGKERVPVVSGLACSGNELFVSLNDLAGLLDYTCSFDIASNVITAADTDVSAITPTRFDLQNAGACLLCAIRAAMEPAGPLRRPVRSNRPCIRRRRACFRSII